MKVSSYRNTYAQISLEAIEENAASFKNWLQTPDCKLMAVVKGDGYGHGAIEAAKAALRGGAAYLGVAILDEALELRNAGIDIPILVLGYTAPDALKEAVRNNISVTVFSVEVRDALIELANLEQTPIKIHIKVETGMGRVGVQTTEELLDLATPLFHHNIKVEGLFTHFAEADSPASTYTDQQFERFTAFIHALEDKGMFVPIKHCCNSAGTLFHKDKHLDMVRVGISLYGLKPDVSLEMPMKLKQAMRLYSSIVSLRKLHEGSSISYGRTYTLPANRTIATLPIGYADGLSRALSNKGFALVNRQKAHIVGRVCMDQTMIDVTDLADVQAGDSVEFPIDEMAEVTGTINYEVVCSISKRVPRYYEEGCTKSGIELVMTPFVTR
ncbi:alanine racemase [Halalkalibacter alkaliphilus]|uniref:Alanine racemase n=1 Tax=Halalkalibacter alkaliphilus TaxID=2917993 RepID=A0A9X2I633_9BACI|nr:alanine racemase [Halalkalibacter alkaliphilus]MCL7747519.1 alanine racemase [Halalkalibacter alkaliphilus]